MQQTVININLRQKIVWIIHEKYKVKQLNNLHSRCTLICCELKRTRSNNLFEIMMIAKTKSRVKREIQVHTVQCALFFLDAIWSMCHLILNDMWTCSVHFCADKGAIRDVTCTNVLVRVGFEFEFEFIDMLIVPVCE